MKGQKTVTILSTLAALVTGSLVLGSAEAQTPAPIALIPSELLYPAKQDGYRPLVPIRADFGPGFVFTGQLKRETLIFGTLVCPNLYPRVRPTDAAVVLTNYSNSSSRAASTDLSLLDRILGWSGPASLDAKYRNKVNYTVTLGSVSESYIPLSEMWKDDKPLPVDPKCHSAIEELKLKNQFANSVFVVSRALTTQGLSFKFDTSVDAAASLTTEIKNAVKAGASGSVSVSDSGGNTIVNVATPIHLGIQVELVDRWVPSGAVGAAARSEAVVNGHPLPGNYELQIE